MPSGIFGIFIHSLLGEQKRVQGATFTRLISLAD